MNLLMIRFGTFLFLLIGASAQSALFQLSDSDPDSPEFRRRFFASHGVNEAIEPKLTAVDRPLQEAILPHLRDNPRQAISLIEQALTPDTNPAFLSILGNLYYQVNDYASAERYLKQTLEKFPSLRRAWRTLALTYVQRDLFREAVAPLLKVIELGGGDGQSYGLLAYCHLTNEKYESALAAYRMARMFNPDSLDFRRGQAQCLLMTEQHRSAVALYDELISENPNEHMFWLAQVNSYLALDRREEAIANLEIVAETGGANWSSLVMLGDLYLNEDVPQLALKAYRKGVEEHAPGDWSSALRPLRYLLERRLFAEARDYFELVRDRVSGRLEAKDERELRVSEARIEMRVGDPGKGFVILMKAIEADPLDGPSLLLLGEYHQGRSEFEKAEYYFERATSSREHEVDAQIALGRLAVDRGDLRAALVSLRKAQQLRSSPRVQRYIESIERAIDARR